MTRINPIEELFKNQKHPNNNPEVKIGTQEMILFVSLSLLTSFLMMLIFDRKMIFGKRTSKLTSTS